VKIIHKQKLSMDYEFALIMPKGAEILSAQVQHNHGVIWYSGDTMCEELESRRFKQFVTGDPFSEGGLFYIATLIYDGGNFVHHLYEVVS